MNEPRKIGRYHVQKLLGEGAMGSVFQASDPNIGRTVAIKIVKVDAHASGGEDTAGFRERFQQEARISGNLNHPNIVAVYDVDQHNGMPYIAMEFVEGDTLAQYIRGPSKPSSVELVHLLGQLAGALDFAHSSGVVHRDLKPANIMVTHQGVPKIMDFGIAKTSGSNLTMTGVFLGTPSYSSPEQVKEGHVDHRSDIFAFGILACEVLTGSLPFPGKSINAILYKIANEPPSFPASLGSLPIPLPRFKEIFSKTLDKDSDKRYQSALAFTKDLEDALEVPPEMQQDLDQTVRLQPTVVSGSAIKKKLERSEFETAASEELGKTISVQSPKKKHGMLALLVPLLLVVVVFYLHQSGELEPLLSQLKGQPSEKVVETVEPPPKKVSHLLTKQLSFTSTPTGAEISLNNQKMGTTPYDHNWQGKQGELLQWSLRLAGYHEHHGQLALNESLALEQAVILKQMPVEHTLTSVPTGATVRLNGTKLGSTPQAYTFKVGESYRLAFSKDGYLNKRSTYTEGTTPVSALAVRLKPKPKPGRLVVDTLLEDLELLIDGRQRKSLNLSLEPGSYKLRLRSRKYFYDASRTIQVQSEQTLSEVTPIVITIPKIDLIGGYANVKIDGHFVEEGGEPDTTPLVNLPVTAGPHVIEFVDQNGAVIQKITREVTRSENIVVSVDP